MSQMPIHHGVIMPAVWPLERMHPNVLLTSGVPGGTNFQVITDPKLFQDSTARIGGSSSGYTALSSDSSSGIKVATFPDATGKAMLAQSHPAVGYIPYGVIGNLWGQVAATRFLQQHFRWGQYVPGAAGTIYTSVGPYGVPTAYGTVSAITADASGRYNKYITAASANDAAGLEWFGTAYLQRRWGPIVGTRIKLDATITSYRLQFGIADSVSVFGADDPTVHWSGLRFSTAAGDTTWKAITNDNSGGGTITDTTVACTADTAYDLYVDESVDAQVTLGVRIAPSTTSNGNAAAFTTITHTTNLPTDSTARAAFVLLENLAASARYFYMGGMYWSQR